MCIWRVSIPRPSAHKTDALTNWATDTFTRSGIRTHEANATDLKSVPFDHSGIRVMTMLGRQTVRSINMDQFFFHVSTFFTHLHQSTSTHRTRRPMSTGNNRSGVTRQAEIVIAWCSNGWHGFGKLFQTNRTIILTFFQILGTVKSMYIGNCLLEDTLCWIVSDTSRDNFCR